LRIHYIAVFYFSVEQSGVFSLAKRDFSNHLEALAGSPSNSFCKKITFVVNSDLQSLDREIKEAFNVAMEKFNLPVELEIRSNSGYSYGAWQDVIERNLLHDEDFFLIEGDYLPNGPFLLPFLEALDPSHGYVAQKLNNKPILHASVSNGYLSNKWAKAAKRRFGSVFCIFPFSLGKQDYILGCENQLTFLNYVMAVGGKVTEVDSKFSCPYWNNEIGNWQELGTSGAYAPIVPSQGFSRII
jgi:hypothetical protein